MDDIESQKQESRGTELKSPARTLTIHDDGRTLQRTLHRTHSIRETVPLAARIPTEFRTLSIHVDDHTARRVPSTLSDKYLGKHKGPVTEITALEWHIFSIEQVLQRLSVAEKTGLDDAQVQRRRTTYGKNVLSPPPNRMWLKVLGWVFGGFGSLLFVGSIICFIAWRPLGGPNPQPANLALAVVILIVIVLQAIFNAWQDFSMSSIMKSIKTMLPSDVQTFRDGKYVTIPIADLVVGDIVQIQLGQQVPADLRLVECAGDTLFDRSILTGDDPIPGRLEKTDDNFLETRNIALQGTICVGGSGRGVVIQTGDRTVFGRTAKLASTAPTGLTTLQKEILRLVLIIATLALTISMFIVILWAALLRIKFPNYINVPGLLINVVSVTFSALTLLYGLPVAVTLSLAKIAQILARNKVLCKSLSIVETLGSVNVLCSDKTGTLTQNKMHVEEVAILDTLYSARELKKALDSADPHVKENLSQIPSISSICNDALFESSSGDHKIKGNATDSAILSFSDAVGTWDQYCHPWTVVFKQGFNSKTKFMMKLSKLSSLAAKASSKPAPIASWDNFQADDFLMMVKGAPDVLLPRCGYALDPLGGRPLPLTETIHKRIVSVQESWAGEGRRVLLLARRVIPADDIPPKVDYHSQTFSELIDELNTELIIVGMVSLLDPLKPDIAETVKVCRGAGIRFMVVTGDHPLTSVAIAAKAGIISNPKAVHNVSNLDPKLSRDSIQKYDPQGDHEDPMRGIVVTGSELMSLNDSQIEQLVHYDEIVFARTTPEQKLRIVHEFKSRDNVVAMTGDGTNDGPSLKAADIGIAMGNGSDVAKEAADMILLEEFSAIMVALQYGRLVFDNLKKTTIYLLPAGTFSELMPVLLNILIGVPQILSSIQMIIISIGTDVLPALAMCLEKPESDILTRKPRNVKTQHLVDWKLLLHAYGFIGILESLSASSMAFVYLQRQGVQFSELVVKFGDWSTLEKEQLYRAQSVYFFTLVIMQWGNLLASRCRRQSIFTNIPLRNWICLPACIMSLIIAVFFSYIPWFQKIFLTRGVNVEYFFIPMAFGLGILSLDEMRKYSVRKNPKGVLARIAW